MLPHSLTNVNKVPAYLKQHTPDIIIIFIFNVHSAVLTITEKWTHGNRDMQSVQLYKQH